MSIGLSVAFTAAKSALSTTQQQLAVISNNVANASDSSYHKQTASVSNNTMVEGLSGYFGTGCHVSDITREYDLALETSLRSAISDNSYQQEYATQIAQVEDVIGPDGEAVLSDAMLEFTNAIQDVINNPEDTSVRTALLGTAETLCEAFNSNYEDLESLRDYIASNNSTGSGAISEICDDLQSKLERIAELNENISNIESDLSMDAYANTLRDERDALCSEVAEYISIEVSEESDGKYTIEVNLDGGTTATLIDGTTSPQADPDYLTVSMVEDPTGFFTPQIELSSDPGTAITLTEESGEIRALLDSREYITEKMTELYDYASEFSAAVNALQNQEDAYDLNGNNNAGDLFSVSASQPASGSIISVDITDPEEIAASTSADQQGNGENAQALWDKLNEDDLIEGGSYLEYANTYLANIAQDVSDATGMAETTQNIQDMYQNAVSEKSGVSTDEEMASMLEVQRAYQAAAKLIQVVDEMIQTVLNMI